MKTQHVLVASLMVATVSLHAQLVYYSFTGSAGNEVSFPPDAPPLNATASSLSRGSGLSPSSFSGAFSSSGFTLSSTLDSTDYYAFTIAPSAGYQLSLSSLELDERRSGTGPRDWLVRSSLDDFGADLGVFTVPDGTSTRTDQATSLGASFANLVTPVEFRVYGFAAESGAGTWRVDNVQLYGAATPVPEPEHYALLVGVGLAGLAAWRSRFAQAQ